MSDTFSAEKRSWIMSRIQGENTTPERKVRSLAHKLGFRFRLHRKDLPGKPDIVFPARKKVIFVHGCFWHGHNCARGKRIPKANTAYWNDKIQNNRARDLRVQRELRLLGWDVLIVWECELKNIDNLAFAISQYLSNNSSSLH